MSESNGEGRETPARLPLNTSHRPLKCCYRSLTPKYSPKNWTAVAVSAFIAAAAITGMLTASRILSARRSPEENKVKLTTYECGIPATPYTWSNINVRFYIFAILFLIFDVEAVFLFPWAVIFLQDQVTSPALLRHDAVPGRAGFAIVYAWRKGVLEWQK